MQSTPFERAWLLNVFIMICFGHLKLSLSQLTAQFVFIRWFVFRLKLKRQVVAIQKLTNGSWQWVSKSFNEPLIVSTIFYVHAFFYNRLHISRNCYSKEKTTTYNHTFDQKYWVIEIVVWSNLFTSIGCLMNHVLFLLQWLLNQLIDNYYDDLFLFSFWSK